MPLLAHSLTASRSHSPATNDHDKTNVLAVLGLNLVRIQDPGIRRAPPPSPGRAQAEAASAAADGAERARARVCVCAVGSCRLTAPIANAQTIN